MTPADTRLLQEIYRREFRSLLQYVREAAPYTPIADRPVRDGLLRIANEETAELTAFGDWMEATRIPRSYLGSFPVAFTDLNFVQVRHLLPKLVTEQKRDIQLLEQDAVGCTDDMARTALRNLIEVHKRHLKELESFG